ncbi:hypothetical protein NCH01_08700 [Neoasaia chiangmaiensis]|uniref:Uncharacterized protein n=1 Tax=Neoasaia chiangmaiensis TaxID=320497 RepID=A0A1U9KPX5_9PROT|nr:DUF2939 domain-containing protein [Neoasaia chiangmaiensis]AQS87823.1 hypothetical protein A0U93_07610 [Neoasaia chiangmaiensis]GEN14439.1 hypothetical protein NCH01_08700 [Neoasaia chiangmaiensis]
MRRLARLQLLPAHGIAFASRAMPQTIAARPHHWFGAFFLAVICAYALSPFMALWSIDGALKSHDANTLATHIDWSALTDSLKQQTISAINGPAAAADDLPDFGSSFATSAVSHAIDTRLTTDSLLTMATQMMPAGQQPASWRDLWSKFSARFVGLTGFEARLASRPGQAPTTVHMKFEHWHWKVTRLELPAGA